MSEQQTESVWLKDRLEHWITQRTGGRVHNLSVDVMDDQVIIYGSAATHHVRQLALVAATEVLEFAADGKSRIDLRIQMQRQRDWRPGDGSLSEEIS